MNRDSRRKAITDPNRSVRKYWMLLLLMVLLSLIGQTGCTRDDLVAAVSTISADLRSTLEPVGTASPFPFENQATAHPLTTIPAAIIEDTHESVNLVANPTESPTTPSPSPVVELTATPLPPPPSVPTPIPTEEPLPTLSSTPKATTIPAEIEVDGGTMIFIPGGFFEMGASAESLLEECNTFREGCQIEWFAASDPAHLVLVAPYFLDANEVTNEAFIAFLGEQGNSCQGQPCYDPEESQIVVENDIYSTGPDQLRLPAAGVTWYGATAFCEWRGSRLPTEAEWEYAAGWDSRMAVKTRYPWGDIFDGTLANFCDVNCDAPQADDTFNDGFATAAPVASYESGRSASGIYDMAGNVWEWVSDWYAEDFYSDAIYTNPVGPESGDDKVVRGGSWFDTGNFTSTVIRFPSPPTNADKTIGFRCAMALPRP